MCSISKLRARAGTPFARSEGLRGVDKVSHGTRPEAFRDVEHVLPDATAGRLADEHNVKRTLMTLHIASTRA